MHANLISEMARQKISISAMAETLGVHRNSMRNKLYGASAFTLDEAMLIFDTYFSNCEFRWLFKRVH